jgi:rhodanese-related sulfurtransferase
MFLISAAMLGASLVLAPTTVTSAQQSDRISLDAYRALLASNTPVVTLDVRGGGETKIKGALHIPLTDLEARIKEIPRDREIVTYCA